MSGNGTTFCLVFGSFPFLGVRILASGQKAKQTILTRFRANPVFAEIYCKGAGEELQWHTMFIG